MILTVAAAQFDSIRTCAGGRCIHRPYSDPNLIQNLNGSRACRTCKALNRNKGSVLGAVLRESLRPNGA